MYESFINLKTRALAAVEEYRQVVNETWRANDGGLTWAAGDEINSCNYATKEIESAASSNELLRRLSKTLPALHLKEA